MCECNYKKLWNILTHRDRKNYIQRLKVWVRINAVVFEKVFHLHAGREPLSHTVLPWAQPQSAACPHWAERANAAASGPETSSTPSPAAGPKPAARYREAWMKRNHIQH